MSRTFGTTGGGGFKRNNFGGNRAPAVIIPSYDPQAAAYLNAVGIPNDATPFYAGTPQARTGANFWTYIDKYVKDLKTAGLWSKIYVRYPFLGGTFARHSYNLKNPATFQIPFTAAIWTHSATGATPDNVNSPSTGFNPSASVPDWITNSHLAVYSRTPAQTGNGWNIGVGDTSTGNPLFGLACHRGNGTAIYDSGNAGTGRTTATVADGSGYTLGSCTAANLRNLYKNGAVLANNVGVDTAAASNAPMWVGAMNPFPAGGIYSCSDQVALVSVGAGFTAQNAADDWAITQALQTSLGRNV